MRKIMFIWILPNGRPFRVTSDTLNAARLSAAKLLECDMDWLVMHEPEIQITILEDN